MRNEGQLLQRAVDNNHVTCTFGDFMRAGIMSLVGSPSLGPILPHRRRVNVPAYWRCLR